MNRFIIATLMLICSNVFMTFAWYGHLKNYNDKPWIVASIISWGIALFEYLLQVPANRIGHQGMNLRRRCISCRQPFLCSGAYWQND